MSPSFSPGGQVKVVFLKLQRIAVLLVIALSIRELSGAQTEQILHRFSGGNDGAIGDQGSLTYGGLTSDRIGNLYGTTPYGGGSAFCSLLGSPQGCGTVFQLTPPAGGVGAWTETVLYSFDLNGSGDGIGPTGGLVMDKAGNFYGTTFTGQGAYAAGTVFELSPPSSRGGSWTETILYSFGSNGARDGASPNGSLIMDAAGNLFGTTQDGGALNNGTVFELSPPISPGGAWTETVLHSFGNGGAADGLQPFGGLLRDPSGILFGATANGGISNFGTVYELVPGSGSGSWTERVIYRFKGGLDGANPYGSLILSRGVLYGTTRGNLLGTVYELSSPGGLVTHTVIYSFTARQDGQQPHAGLAIDGSGNLYGTTTFDGAFAQGTVFQLVPPSPGGNWTENEYNFNGGTDGAHPVAPVLLIGNSIYGMTSQGGDQSCSINGESGCGTVFRIGQ